MKLLLIFIYSFFVFLSLKGQIFQANIPLLQVNEITYKCKWFMDELYIQNQQNNITDAQMYRGITNNPTSIGEDEPDYCISGIYFIQHGAYIKINDIVQSKFTDTRALEIRNQNEGSFTITYYIDLGGKIKAVYFSLKGATNITPQEIYTIEKALIDLEVPINFGQCNWVSGSYLRGQVRVKIRNW